MNKTSAFYTPKHARLISKSSFKFAVISILLLGLSACTNNSIKPAKPDVVASSKPDTKHSDDRLNQTPEALSINELKLLQANATTKGNWSDYLYYSTLLWNKSNQNEAYQNQLENQAWSIVNSLSAQNIAELENSSYPEAQAWVSLLNAFKGSKYQIKQSLMNLNSFEADAIYHKHLLPRLLAEQPKSKSIHQIAVLLPMEGRYKVISQQIRSGIMKAFYASNQTITLKFYDSSELANLEATYTQAKQDGADRIIGPLRREALQILASFHDDNLLALNSIDSHAFTQFSFKSSQPNLQMVKKFETAGFERIGILSNDAHSSLGKAQELNDSWIAAGHSAILSVYPDQKPKLRKALGQLIHENLSKERQNNLRWLVGRKLDYFPRTRQDLDAIVIFDNAFRMAVFRPQFDFFELDTPVFGDTELTPANFQAIKQNPDLKSVSFLTYPATLNPVDLTSKFEAFGWDSFMVSTHNDALQNGNCLTNTKTGILRLDGNEIKQKLVWAKYDKTGTLLEEQE
ncbi:penicillin-binding protein activator [Thiomicrorhabdus sp. Milos-T2]|uniref:penicillin-binding protein activator n=1 Tax=Thiomicrorhabdus sp. Milos-T2 TaxID=90814 RepID=UPI0004946A03|nr:penicillin-binding protein activator [Thiomicrorhabdus sp. Milos-T2]